MKKYIIPIIFFVLHFSVYTDAQTIYTKTIFDCNANLVNNQFNDKAIKIITNVSYAKPHSKGIAPDVDYISHNPEVYNCDKTGSSLKYDIYYPVTDKNQCALPAIFLIHPGAFSDSSNKDQPGMRVYSTELAKRGFVVFNVEYRRGTNLDPIGRTSASYILAMYRSFQDLRGAIRSAIKMQRDSVFQQFNFNEDYIFLGGAGTTPINVAYYDQQMMDIIEPDESRVLGPLQADYYYGDTTIKYSVKGVLNLWGVALTPLDSKILYPYFKKKQKTLAPIISFHGVKDPYANYISEQIKYSNSPYDQETSCLLQDTMKFKLINDNGREPDILTNGSQTIYDFFKNVMHKPTELYLDCAMDHGLDHTSGFGTGTSDMVSVEKYIVQRAATFFQAVVNGKADSLRDTRFVDCQNYRHGCSIADNNNNCKNNDACASTAKIVNNEKKENDPVFTTKQIGRTVEISLLKPGSAFIQIYNINGFVSKQIKSDSQTIWVSASDFKSGIYVIRVVQNNAMQSKTVAF